jgi:hypothetical protein
MLLSCRTAALQLTFKVPAHSASLHVVHGSRQVHNTGVLRHTNVFAALFSAFLQALNEEGCMLGAKIVWMTLMETRSVRRWAACECLADDTRPARHILAQRIPFPVSAHDLSTGNCTCTAEVEHAVASPPLSTHISCPDRPSVHLFLPSAHVCRTAACMIFMLPAVFLAVCLF